MINADVVIPTRLGKLVAMFKQSDDVIIVGERLDCRVNPALKRLPKSVSSFEDLERWVMAPCWPHGSDAKDFFMYRKGLFGRRGLTIPPFWVGKQVWDSWLLHKLHDIAIDITPSMMVGHFSHDSPWGLDSSAAVHRNVPYTELRLKEVSWNQNLLSSDCGDASKFFTCLAHGSTYNAAWMLCPNSPMLRPMHSMSSTLYPNAIEEWHGVLKPSTESAEMQKRRRRVYQEFSLTGVSPRYWNDPTLVQWGRRHGC